MCAYNTHYYRLCAELAHVEVVMTTHSLDDLSAYCKAHCGLDAKTVADMALISRRTLYNWWQTRRRTVELIVSGVRRELENVNNEQ